MNGQLSLWRIAGTGTPEVGSQRLDDVIGMSSVWLARIHEIAALHTASGVIAS